MITGKNLYLVLTEGYSNKPILEIASEAIDAGVDIVQMREKSKPTDELLKLGAQLRKLSSGITFIVNDNPELALQLGADGVHLGQEDYKKHVKVRDILKDKIIGLSTHSLEEVKRANDQDVDYIAFGPIFKTRTKDYSVGLGDVKSVLDVAKKPVVFIGGIDEENIDHLIDRGASNIAVIRAITQSQNIYTSVKELKSKINKDIFLTLNGQPQSIKSATVTELIAEKKFNRNSIIVEYNKEVIRSEDWDKIILKDNDNLEIVGIFSGG